MNWLNLAWIMGQHAPTVYPTVSGRHAVRSLPVQTASTSRNFTAGTTLSQTGQAIEIIAITMGVYLLISLVTSAIMSFYGWRLGRSMG